MVFGVVLRMPFHPDELPAQHEWIRALHNAKAQMAEMTAKAGLQTAVNGRAPIAMDAEIKVGDMVLVFHDHPEQRIGPHCVIVVNKTVVHIGKGGRLIQYSIVRCKGYPVEKEVQALLHN